MGLADKIGLPRASVGVGFPIMSAHPHIEVLDCCETSRREFLKKAGLSAAAVAAAQQPRSQSPQSC